MANLNVQPKRKSYAWLWIIIVILILGGVAYYFMVYKNQGIAPGTSFQQYPSLQWQAAYEKPANLTRKIS